MKKKENLKLKTNTGKTKSYWSTFALECLYFAPSHRRCYRLRSRPRKWREAPQWDTNRSAARMKVPATADGAQPQPGSPATAACSGEELPRPLEQSEEEQQEPAGNRRHRPEEHCGLQPAIRVTTLTTTTQKKVSPQACELRTSAKGLGLWNADNCQSSSLCFLLPPGCVSRVGTTFTREPQLGPEAVFRCFESLLWGKVGRNTAVFLPSHSFCSFKLQVVVL